MGQVEEFKRQAYSGAVADRVEINPLDGDTFYATDTDQLFIGHGGTWVHWPRFVERLAATEDFSIVDFTTNGVEQVNGLDLSAIVPASAFIVKLKLLVRDDAADSYVRIRRDAVNVTNNINGRVFVANIDAALVQDVSIDTDRLLDYLTTNTTFTAIFVTVLGWWR